MGNWEKKKIAEYPSGRLMVPPATQRAGPGSVLSAGRNNKKPEAPINLFLRGGRVGKPRGEAGRGVLPTGLGGAGLLLAQTPAGHPDQLCPIWTYGNNELLPPGPGETDT